MPEGSSSEAPVTRPGPSVRAQWARRVRPAMALRETDDEGRARTVAVATRALPPSALSNVSTTFKPSPLRPRARSWSGILFEDVRQIAGRDSRPRVSHGDRQLGILVPARDVHQTAGGVYLTALINTFRKT